MAIVLPNLDTTEWSALLTRLDACAAGKKFCANHDLSWFWENADRADWMLWVLGKMQGRDGWPTRNVIVDLAVDCAETVLKFSKRKDEIAKELAVVRAWTKGAATSAELSEARSKLLKIAASAASASASASAASAYAASASASAASASAYAAAAADAADAASSIRRSGSSAAADSPSAAALRARQAAHLEMCALIRAKVVASR